MDLRHIKEEVEETLMIQGKESRGYNVYSKKEHYVDRNEEAFESLCQRVGIINESENLEGKNVSKNY